MTDLRELEGAGEFACICADPAWHHKSYSVKGQARSPSSHYKTMSLEEICDLPVAQVAGKNCHLFLWTTQPHLEQSFSVLRAWGFKYSSVFQFWVKLNPRRADTIWMELRDFHIGMGFTSRKNVEILLLGRRGQPRRLRKDIPDLLIAARRQHSRKPDLGYQRMEAYCVGPRLDMFARESRPGWTGWGFEAQKFDQPKPLVVTPFVHPEPAPMGPMPDTPIFDGPLQIPPFLPRRAAK